MHDKYGRELFRGDFVLIPAKITNLSSTEEYCNVTAVSVFGRRPDGAKETFCINAGIAVRADLKDFGLDE